MRLRHEFGRACSQPWLRARVWLAIGVAIVVAGCANSDTTVTGSIAAAGVRTIAFESVDGPPREVFDRFVAALSSEAERRELPVITHTVATDYRVRAYLATFIERRRKRATLAWTWEVLDTRNNGTFRLTGEESLGAPKQDVWAQIDDALLLRIASRGFEELSARLQGETPPETPAPASPAPAGPAIASSPGETVSAFTNRQ